MSGYTYNDTITVNPLPGIIVQYIGTSDPEGWVICDGVTRTNNSDNRYNNLNGLGIGTGGSGTTNYTPVDLKSVFLYGAANSSELNSIGGAANVALSVNQLPSHTHNMQHGHYVSIPANNPAYGYCIGGNLALSGKEQYKLASDGTYRVRNGVSTTEPYLMNPNNTNSTKPDTGSTGSGTAFSIMPPYYTVNYIMKL
jgi:microcystin-dependent protein